MLIKYTAMNTYDIHTLPNVFEKPAIFIVNTDKAGAPGQHWVSIYISKKGHCEYFDSFGMPPYIPAHVDFINRHSKKLVYNNVSFQSMDSSLCGHYCCVY
ncbi:hypothetical protein B566_EDAN011072, partial [Ephemera danica]